MKKWFNERFDEPTSWIATAGFLQLLGIIFKVDEAEIVAESVVNSAEKLAAGDYVSATIDIATGVLLAGGFVKREKARN